MMRYEEDVMTRRYYPFVFQVLDPDGTTLYITQGFREIGYDLKEMVLINAGNKKDTREKILFTEKKDTLSGCQHPCLPG